MPSPRRVAGRGRARVNIDAVADDHRAPARWAQRSSDDTLAAVEQREPVLPPPRRNVRGERPRRADRSPSRIHAPGRSGARRELARQCVGRTWPASWSPTDRSSHARHGQYVQRRPPERHAICERARNLFRRLDGLFLSLATLAANTDAPIAGLDVISSEITCADPDITLVRPDGQCPFPGQPRLSPVISDRTHVDDGRRSPPSTGYPRTMVTYTRGQKEHTLHAAVTTARVRR